MEPDMSLKGRFFDGLPPDKQISRKELIKTNGNNFVGKGGEARVTRYQLKDKDSGSLIDVAVKSVSIEEVAANRSNANFMDNGMYLHKEARILDRLNNPYILKYFGSFYDEGEMGIIVQYHSYKSLDCFLENSSPQTDIKNKLQEEFTNTSEMGVFINVLKRKIQESWIWPLKRQIAYEVADGLCYLHQNQIIHLDIKAANVLVSDQLHAQISDFGCAFDVNDSATHSVDATAMTYTHAAPERLETNEANIDGKCDVYSYGVFLWELLTEQSPFQDNPVIGNIPNEEKKDFYKKYVVDQENRPDLDFLNNDAYGEVIKKCWSKIPSGRPSSADIKEKLRYLMNNEDFKRALNEINQKEESSESSQSLYSGVSSKVSKMTELSSSTQRTQSGEDAFSQLPSTSVNQPNNDSNCNQSFFINSDTQKLLDTKNHAPDNPIVNRNDRLKRRKRIIIYTAVFACILILGTFMFLAIKYLLPWDRQIYSKCVQLQHPANGNINCSKNKCFFSCPDGYRLMKNSNVIGTNNSICHPGNKSHPTSWWTNPVPYCEKVNYCSALEELTGFDSSSWCDIYGQTMTLESVSQMKKFPNGSNCKVSCSSLYVLHGSNQFECAASSLWQPKPPTCLEKECPPLNLTQFVDKSCTNDYDVGSTCRFSCTQELHLIGPTTITCENTMKWSNEPPVCKDKCPKCTTGPSCKQTTSWQKLKSYIVDKPLASFTAYFAGYSIKCKINKHGGVFSFHWDCTCTDILTSTQNRCNDYASPSGSCEHTLAALVRTMVKAGHYPQPCDASTMPTDCG